MLSLISLFFYGFVFMHVEQINPTMWFWHSTWWENDHFPISMKPSGQFPAVFVGTEPDDAKKNQKNMPFSEPSKWFLYT